MQDSLISQKKAGVLCMAATVLFSGCGGGNSTYEESEVKAAFAKHDIALGEVARPHDAANPLTVVLRPTRIPQNCETTDLTVNVFDDSNALERELGRRFKRPLSDRYESGTSLVLIRRNLFVGLERRPGCFRERVVEAALDDLP
jgi:hypothetical protein